MAVNLAVEKPEPSLSIWEDALAAETSAISTGLAADGIPPRPNRALTQGANPCSTPGETPQKKQRFIALTDDSGKPLRSKSTPVAELKAAVRRIVAERNEDANEGLAGVTVLDVCDAYLAKVIGDGATKTYNDRADTLFDFC